MEWLSCFVLFFFAFIQWLLERPSSPAETLTGSRRCVEVPLRVLVQLNFSQTRTSLYILNDVVMDVAGTARAHEAQSEDCLKKSFKKWTGMRWCLSEECDERSRFEKACHGLLRPTSRTDDVMAFSYSAKIASTKAYTVRVGLSPFLFFQFFPYSFLPFLGFVLDWGVAFASSWSAGIDWQRVGNPLQIRWRPTASADNRPVVFSRVAMCLAKSNLVSPPDFRDFHDVSSETDFSHSCLLQHNVLPRLQKILQKIASSKLIEWDLKASSRGFCCCGLFGPHGASSSGVHLVHSIPLERPACTMLNPRAIYVHAIMCSGPAAQDEDSRLHLHMLLVQFWFHSHRIKEVKMGKAKRSHIQSPLCLPACAVFCLKVPKQCVLMSDAADGQSSVP